MLLWTTVECIFKNLPYLHSCCLWLALRPSSRTILSPVKNLLIFCQVSEDTFSENKNKNPLKQQLYRLQMCGLLSVEDVWVPKATV